MGKSESHKTAGGVMRRIVTFLFAMFLGAALLVASVFGGTYAAIKWVTLDHLEGVGVTLPEGILTEESPVREMSVIDLVTELSALPGRLSEVTLNSLVAEYGVMITEDVMAMIPAALRDTPLSDFSGDDFLTTVLSKITFGDAFVYTGEILTEAAREKLADRTLDLLAEQDFAALLEGVYVGDLLGMEVALGEDGLVHPVLAEGETAYIGHYLATVDLGEYFSAEDGNTVLNDTLARVPLSDMLSDSEDTFFSDALEDMMLGDILTVEGAGFTFALEPILDDLYLGDVLGYHPVYLEDGITLSHWEDDSGKHASGIYRELVGVLVNDLDDTDLMSRIDGVYIGELLDYTRREDGVDADGNPKYVFEKQDALGNTVVPEGAIAELVGLTVQDLRDEETLDREIKEMQVGVVMGYTQTAEGKWLDENSEPVRGVMRPLLDSDVADLADRVDALYLGEIMGFDLVTDPDGTPVLDANGKKQFADGDGKVPDSLMQNFVDMTLSEIDDDGAFSTRVQEVLVGDAMGYTYDDTLGWCEEDEDGMLVPVTGIFRTLAGHKVKDMNTAVKEVSVADALDFTYNTAEGRWEDENSQPVKGILRLLAEKRLDNLSSAVDAVYLGEIMGYDVLRDADGNFVDEDEHVVSAPVFRKGEAGSYEAPKGVISKFLDIKVSMLSDTTEMTNRIDALSIGEAMSYEKVGDTWYDRNGTPLAESNQLLLSIIDTKVMDVGARMNSLELKDILGYTKGDDGKWYKGTEEVTGFMALVGPDTKINGIEKAINDLQTSVGVGEFVDAGILTMTDTQKNDLNTKVPGWREMPLKTFVDALLVLALS